MSVYCRYFRFTQGPVADEISRLFGIRHEVGALYKTLADKYGAESANSWQSNGAFAGFVFKTPPDKSVYRLLPKHRLWAPRKNVPAGKAIWAEINALPVAEPVEKALKLVGLECGMPMLTDAGRWYAPTLWGRSGPPSVWYVSVPWQDVDPAKLSQYKADKAAGKCFDLDLEALMWEVPEGWTEVKHWQIQKEQEEFEAEEAK